MAAGRPLLLQRCAAALLLAACTGAAAAPVQVEDDTGRTVTLAQPARRAVALAPHLAELAHAAGAGAYLVGAVRGTDFPDAARQLPSVGDGLRPDAERVAALRPDLLLAWQPGALHTLSPILGSGGTPVYFSQPRTLDDIPSSLLRLGRLFGTEAAARAEADRLQARIDALTARYAGHAPVKVFVQAGEIPLYALGDGDIVGDLLRRCGAVNVFGSLPRAAAEVSVESVLAAAPDAIVAGTGSAADGARIRQAWQARGAPAARAGHVYAVDADALYRPGPRLVDAAEQLCAMLDDARS
ncbi:cobalamin-binding protein [Bordetella sp. 2513F-2]